MYGISIIAALICIVKLLSFATDNTRMFNTNSTNNLLQRLLPYLVSVLYMIPPLAFSLYVNSGLPKNDDEKIKMFQFTYLLLAILVLFSVSAVINVGFWALLDSIDKYAQNAFYLSEFAISAVRILCLVVPFRLAFSIADYLLGIYESEDLTKSIAGFVGLTISGNKKKDGTFSCDTVIGTAKGTAIPIVVSEKKRYESTLVQGATGTGKTATVLLPMSALDLEKKFFFREYAKKIK